MLYFVPITYKDYFAYLTPFEILFNVSQAFLSAFFIITIFKKLLNKTLPITLQLLLIIFYVQGTNSTVGYLIYIITAVFLIYYWGFSRSVDFNTISFTFIFSAFFLQLIIAVLAPIFYFIFVNTDLKLSEITGLKM
ncbi:hypothetical protein G5T19_07895 [Lactobacillus reuteri]|nr:hypothetical protein [Limosilactobacillus reuteri]